MPRLMIDSDTPGVLLEPRFGGMLVATYADIITPELVAQLGERLVVIDRGHGDPFNKATVADCEPGLLTVEESVARVRTWDAENRPYPTIYHDRVQWAAVNEAAKGLNVHHWVATLDGTLVPSGYYMAVVQFAGENKLGFHADMSIVWDDGWHPQHSAVPAAELALLRSLANTAVDTTTRIRTLAGSL